MTGGTTKGTMMGDGAEIRRSPSGSHPFDEGVVEATRQCLSEECSERLRNSHCVGARAAAAEGWVALGLLVCVGGLRLKEGFRGTLAEAKPSLNQPA